MLSPGRFRTTATLDANGEGGGAKDAWPAHVEVLPQVVCRVKRGMSGKYSINHMSTLSLVLVHSSRIKSCPEGGSPIIYHFDLYFLGLPVDLSTPHTGLVRLMCTNASQPDLSKH